MKTRLFLFSLEIDSHNPEHQTMQSGESEQVFTSAVTFKTWRSKDSFHAALNQNRTGIKNTQGETFT